MPRKQILGLLLVASAIAVAALLWLRGDSSPEAPPGDHAPVATAPVPVESAPATSEPRGNANESQRQQLVVAATDPELDPEIRAALTGFKGRVVDHGRKAVAGCGVRIYRGAMDSILPTVAELADGNYAPRYVAGETITADDGTFLIEGVWPHGLYLLFAGIGTDAPSHRVLSRTPAPGEVLDLGDIVLNDAAIVTGRVVDEDGDPVPGALVRGVDLPGQVIAFLPIERFDPEGAILIREPGSPVRVLEMPAWVKTAFEHLPIPTTRTDADGSFRLVGLVPGNNVIATTKPGLLSDLKTGVTLRGGQEKDLGTIRLRAGEELTGRVIDTAGKPVAGAEVMAGGTVLVAPVDFARRIEVTDADGRFAAEGFPSGKVTVAARRGKADPWLLADPQPILGDVTVTLPAVFKITAQITGPGGAAVPTPRLRLLAGRGNEEAVVMAGLGLLPSVDLGERLTRLEDGRWQIDDLPAGLYVLMASSETAAMATAEVDLTQADAQVVLALPACIEYSVRVVGPTDEPIRSATVYVQEQGPGVREMPFAVGHTDSGGRLKITAVSTPEIRVSAEHPRWGSVHGGCKQGEPELLLRMQQPGWIDGTLSESGKPPAPGKYTVSAEWRPQTRGATEQVPTLTTPDLEGAFTMRALQPGRYRVQVINSLDAITSPGGVASLAQAMFMADDLPRETVDVIAGQGAQVHLQVGVKVETGPTAHVFGLAQVDGRLAGGYVMMAWTPRGRRTAKVDPSGRFDLGQVAVGQVHLNLMEGGDSLLFGRNQGLWNQSLELKAGEEREVSIDVQTTAIEGSVIQSDGSTVPGVMVQAQGRSPPNKDGVSESNWWRSVQTDADGNFRFERVPAGFYDLETESRSDDAQRGRLKGVLAEAGRPAVGLRLLMQQAVIVGGRVDMTAFNGKPDWVYLSFYRVDPNAPNGPRNQVGGDGVQDDGTFQTNELEPGTYEARVYASVTEWQEYEVRDLIEVPPAGRRDLFLRPVLKQRPPEQGRR